MANVFRSSGDNELRGIEKPFYVIVDGKVTRKRLRKELSDAISDRDMAQLKTDYPVGILKVEINKTGFVKV